MSRPVLIIGSLVVLGGLSVAVYMVSSDRAKDVKNSTEFAKISVGDAPKIGVQPVEDGGAPDVDKLTVKNGKQSEVTLEK
jgi:hypothetical protein